MRIRTVKPEWMEDEDLLRAGSDARVLSVCLILLADDYGRGRCIPEVMSAQCFPFEPEHSRVFREALARLSAMRFLRLYEVRGQRYFEIRNWARHQKVDKPGKPHVPEPLDPDPGPSRDTRETLAPDHDLDLRILGSTDLGSMDQEGDHARARARGESPPTPWSEGSTHSRLRLGFERRFLEAESSPPNQRALGAAVATLAPWVEQTADSRKLSVDAVCDKLLTGFFSDPKAHSKHFPPAFLAHAPLEYFEPRVAAANAPRPHTPEKLKSIERAKNELEAAEKAKKDLYRRARERGEEPDLGHVWDAEKRIERAIDDLGRMQRAS